MNLRISVLSLNDFNKYNPIANSLAISIIDNQYLGKDDIKVLDRYGSYIQLSFQDFEVQYDSSIILFSDKQSHQICKFLIENNFGKDESKELVIHCYQGVSRSPAVAIGICFLFHRFEQAYRLIQKYTGFNRYVLGTFIRNIRNNSEEITGGWKI
jgi:predicted protein tyrosine phosphatase